MKHNKAYSKAVLAAAVMLLCPAIASGQLIPSFGGDRAGTAGFQFLKIPVDARSAALGQTVAANAFDASSLFWNPALAAQTGGFEIGFSHTSYFAGVSMDYAGVIYDIGGLTLGASVQALNSGQMDVTTEFQPTGTGETFNVIDVAAGLTVAQSLTDLFSYGVTAKYVHESIAGVTSNTALFDLGIFYRIGGTGAQMAVAIRNFGLNARPSGSIDRIVIGEGPRTVEEFELLTPPTTFLLGLTYDVLQHSETNRLFVSGQLTNPNDNAESFNVGAEYIWNNLLTLRTGYRIGIEEGSLPSFGFGIAVPGIGPNVRFDYGFTRMDRLGNVHRAGLNISLR